MEPLGLLGIIKLTRQILHKNCKHFLCIAFILALPSALKWIVLGPYSSNNALIQHIIASMPIVFKILNPNSQAQLPSPELPPSSSTKQLQPYSLSLLIATFVVFLVCKPLLTFSVCRACLNQSLDMEGSLRGIPRSVINLILTALCQVSVLLGSLVVAMVAVLITVAVFSAMNANLAIPIAIGALGLGMAWAYLVVSFSLADTVAILEEKKGWEAMRKSMYLLGGRKGLAFWLSFVFTVCSFMLLPISALSNEASLLWRCSAAALSLSLQALIALFSMCAHVVLYMSCKSLREEPLNTLIAASAQFGPHQEPSAKYADLETAALSSAL